MRRRYQSLDGDWIVFDGTTKNRYSTEQEATMAERESVFQEYERRYREIRTQAQSLIREIRDVETVRATNPEIEAAVEAAVDGALIGDSTLTKESAEQALLLLASFLAWGQTPVAEGQPVAMAIIYRRD